ncbi:MAG: phosphoribosylanthranilate isomerase [Planctomycetes bacterium]|nr:phosphoribosylanthranilate isomerase [Planctomycetota bacterium]
MWIKICGITSAADARAVAACGADAIGLNFYAASPRAVDAAVAAEVVGSLPDRIEPVGVFVNHPVDSIADICRGVPLAAVQLHGGESPELCAELVRRVPELRIIRAWRMGADGVGALRAHLDALAALDALPWACLIDASVSGRYGGTGQTIDWSALARDWQADWPRLILAGGLTPANVAEAIRVVRPWGIDTAGGVETSPGRKEAERVRQFVQAARYGVMGETAMRGRV